MSNINVRKLQLVDAKGIATVHVLSWQNTYRGLMADEILDSLDIEDRTKKWKEIILADQPNWEGIVAVLDDEVVGWTTYGKSRDENAAENTGELWAIYVHPKFLGKGAGSLMMKEALESLKKMGFRKATLWVLTTNSKSRKWYESKGWHLSGKTKIEKRAENELHETQYQINL